MIPLQLFLTRLPPPASSRCQPSKPSFVPFQALPPSLLALSHPLEPPKPFPALAHPSQPFLTPLNPSSPFHDLAQPSSSFPSPFQDFAYPSSSLPSPPHVSLTIPRLRSLFSHHFLTLPIPPSPFPAFLQPFPFTLLPSPTLHLSFSFLTLPTLHSLFLPSLPSPSIIPSVPSDKPHSASLPTGLPKPPVITSSPNGGESTSYTFTLETESYYPITEFIIKYRKTHPGAWHVSGVYHSPQTLYS